MTPEDAMNATALYFDANHERLGVKFKEKLNRLEDPEMIRFAYLLGMAVVMHFVKFVTPLPDDTIGEMLDACALHQLEDDVAGATVQ